jgi:hypothetical protein
MILDINITRKVIMKKLLKIWTVEAEDGNKANAIYNIGLLYFFGNGVEKNLQLAFNTAKSCFKWAHLEHKIISLLCISKVWVWRKVTLTHMYGLNCNKAWI